MGVFNWNFKSVSPIHSQADTVKIFLKIMGSNNTKYVFFDNAAEHLMLARSIKKDMSKNDQIYFVAAEEDLLDEKFVECVNYCDAKTIILPDKKTFISDKLLKELASDGKTKTFFLSKNADRNISLCFALMQAAKESDTDTTNCLRCRPRLGRHRRLPLAQTKRAVKNFRYKIDKRLSTGCGNIASRI